MEQGIDIVSASYYINCIQWTKITLELTMAIYMYTKNIGIMQRIPVLIEDKILEFFYLNCLIWLKVHVLLLYTQPVYM